MEWDRYFLRIAKAVSKKSKCLSRKIGAVLVKDKAIVSAGYNGPARGVKHCNERSFYFYSRLFDKIQIMPSKDCPSKCPRKEFDYKSGEALFMCQSGHAERNALIQAGRNGISTLGTTLYVYVNQICKDCAIEMINAGVKRLVFLEGQEYDKYSSVILKESDIKIITYLKEEV
jgi:dCMP deaminase